MSTTTTHRTFGPRRHRRAWHPWRWSAPVAPGCDAELGVIADRRRSDAAVAGR